MAYAKKSNESELVRLRDEITDEVNGDAEHLSKSIFGNLGKHPDMERMDNEQIDALYRGAYQRNDRTFLQAEARRDPEQFLKATQRLGVNIPPPVPPMPAVPAPVPLPAAPGLPMPLPVAPPAPAMAPPPMTGVLPTPPVPPLAGPPPSPPVILGPNGQPISMT